MIIILNLISVWNIVTQIMGKIIITMAQDSQQNILKSNIRKRETLII